MSIKEILYSTLQNIVETYLDVVPEDNESLPVIRFFHISTNPSLTGDDRPFSKTHYYEIDLYAENHDENLVLSIENALFSSDLILSISSIGYSTEENIIKTTFQISIEE